VLGGKPVSLGDPEPGDLGQGGCEPVFLSPSPAVGAALTILCVCSVLMSWHATAPMTGTANRSHSLRWVSACLRDHRSRTGSRSGSR
jgi:hypothetical protein